MEQLQSHIWLTASSYMGKSLRISSFIRKPFLISDFATAPLWISLYSRKIWFSFLSVWGDLSFSLILNKCLINITPLCCAGYPGCVAEMPGVLAVSGAHLQQDSLLSIRYFFHRKRSEKGWRGLGLFYAIAPLASWTKIIQIISYRMRKWQRHGRGVWVLLSI